MTDPLDAVMHIMEAAFDPAFGEAWTRKQVSDALTLSNTRLLLADRSGAEPASPADTVGFALTRGTIGEEELLLIAVHPTCRGQGVGIRLMQRFIDQATGRGAERVFLEMREANPAEALYLRAGFRRVGLRKGYYRKSTIGPLDAITFAKDL